MRAAKIRQATRRRVGLALVLVTLGAVACQPPPQPVVITVTTNAAGTDAAPDDGTCEATPGQGDCTLQAAVEEGNAVPRADLIVPAGLYTNLDLTVTGDLRVNRGAPAAVVLGDTTISVAAGGKLALNGIDSQFPDEQPGGQLPLHHPVVIDVGGSLTLRRSTTFNFFSEGPTTGAALTIAPTGTAVVDFSVVGGGHTGVQNNGGLVLYRSSVFGEVGPSLRTDTAAQSTLQASVLTTLYGHLVFSSCTGPSTSLGYNGFRLSGCATQPTDTGATGYGLEGDAPYPVQIVHDASSSSPVIDAIPLGVAGCDASEVDLYGNQRGIDGNDDGVGGCDIGAVERQP